MCVLFHHCFIGLGTCFMEVPSIKERGQSGTNRKGCRNNWPLMLHKIGSKKVCPCLFLDTPITYSLWLLRLPILWVKTENFAPVSVTSSIKWPTTSMTTWGLTLIMYVVSLGRATFGQGPPQSSDCEIINSWGATVTLWHLGHSRCQC